MPSRGERWIGGVVAVAALTVAIIAQLSSRPSPDVAWILYATRELLHGARLGVDLVENSPPMIFALNLPVAALAEGFGVSVWGAWVVAVAGLSAAVTAATASIVRRARSDGGVWPVLVPALLAVLVLVPTGDYGQRDHLALVLAVPYLGLVSMRLEGRRFPAGWAAVVGSLAAMGVGIKPHFALVPVGLAALLWRRRGLRGVVLPEHLAIVTVGAAYLAAVWQMVPEYYVHAREFGPLYQRFLRLDPLTLMLVGEGVLPPLVALGAFAALRGALPRDTSAVADTLAVAMGAFFLAAVLQSKGWRYQFLPALSLSVWLSGLLAWCSGWRFFRVVPRLYATASGLVCIVALAGAGWFAAGRIASPRDPRFDADPSLARLLPLVRAVPEGESVVVLSTNIASGFPLVLDGNARWGLRHPSLWPLAAIYHEQLVRRALVVPTPLELRPAPERQYARSIVDEMVAARPTLVLVLTPSPGLPGWEGGETRPRGSSAEAAIGGEARRFDYLGYFHPEDGMADLLRRYSVLGQVGMYRVLWRSDRPRPAETLLQGTPGS